MAEHLYKLKTLDLSDMSLNESQLYFAAVNMKALNFLVLNRPERCATFDFLKELTDLLGLCIQSIHNQEAISTIFYYAVENTKLWVLDISWASDGGIVMPIRSLLKRKQPIALHLEGTCYAQQRMSKDSFKLGEITIYR